MFLITKFNHCNPLKPSAFTKPQPHNLLRLRKPVLTNKYNRTSLRINNSIDDSILRLNDFVDNESRKFTAKAIVDFSAIYFTLNWIYYRSMRKKMEEREEKEEKD